MEFGSRKLRLWFVSLMVLFSLYLLYNLLFKTPEIKISNGTEYADEQVDINSFDFDKGIGKVSDTGIGKVEMARFTTLNPKTKEIEREFGFETLLHGDSDQWEIEKPYMTIHQPDFKCYITADKGYVMLEADVNPPNPEDAVLTGNVVAHVVPETGSEVEESFFYLDDVTFVSEKSQFSTEGPVKFISKSAEMQGKGFELIYDDELDRLDLLRIVHLDNMHLKAKKGFTLSKKSEEKPPPAKVANSTVTTNATTTPSSPDKKDTYKCMLSGNVVIDTTEQVIVTEQVSINNIFWSENSGKEKKTIKNKDIVSTQTKNMVVTKEATSQATYPEETTDIIVTCNNGIIMTPMDSKRTLESITGTPLSRMNEDQAAEILNSTQNQTAFVSERINYNADNANVITEGLSKLKFYVKDIINNTSMEDSLPMIVTSHKSIKFSPNSNQVLFEGNCSCRLVRNDGQTQNQYMLSAPKLIVDLFAEQSKGSSESAADIKYLSAIANTEQMAKLSSIKISGEKFLGGVELKCPKFEFDNDKQLFIASGPGVIKIDNSKIQETAGKTERFSLQRKCYAVVKNFDSLKYYINSEKMIFENNSGRVIIDYFPIIETGYEQVSVTAGHIEADLVETAEKQYRLWSLLAKGGISYKDQDILLEGSDLFFNSQTSTITVNGDDAKPAYFNGIFFDSFEYNLTTGEVKEIQISRPGLFIPKQ